MTISGSRCVPAIGVFLLALASSPIASQDPRASPSVQQLLDEGRSALDRSSWGDAEGAFNAALAAANKVGTPSLDQAAAVNGLGIVSMRRGDLNKASEYYLRALALREQLQPDSLIVAASLTNLATVARLRSDYPTARDYLSRALRIKQRLAPDSLDLAITLNSLGDVAENEGDLETAEARYQEALAIREKLAPDSLDVSGSLNGLGIVAWAAGDLSAARAYFERALAIREKLRPGSAFVSTVLSNLGMLAIVQRGAAHARTLFEQALAIDEKLAPGSLDVATSLHNLGVTARDQGDYSAARAYFERALTIRRMLAPGSLSVASTLNGIGLSAYAENEFAEARRLFSEALALTEKVAAGSRYHVASLTNLGLVSQATDDLDAAGRYYDRALEIESRAAPRSLEVAVILISLGELAHQRNDAARADEYYRKGLEIYERLAPDAINITDALRDVAALRFESGQHAEAIAILSRAWANVTRDSSLVGGDETRQAFGFRYGSVGSDLVRVQVALGATDRAFATLEEGRAQALLHLLAERDLARKLAPVDLWQRYETARSAADRAAKLLEKRGSEEDRAKLALDAEIAQYSDSAVVEQKRRALTERARATEAARHASAEARVAADARWAEVRSSIAAAIPVADLAAARRILPDRSLLAAFAVGDSESTLFLVRRDGPVQTLKIAASVKELTARVDFVRRTASREADTRGVTLPGVDEVRVQAARDLFDKLFSPEARAAIAAADRVILSPDGVLWDLPFAVLVMNEAGKPKYLGLEKPLAYTQSLTTLAKTVEKRAAVPQDPKSVLVIGNPLYDNALRDARPPAPASGSSSKRRTGELALLSRDGGIPSPLPFAEEEATRIAGIYRVTPHTGQEPTEAWFREHGPQASVIHLATHGYFNPFRAVSSGVYLAVPEREPDTDQTDNDGALQAWEVFTQLRLQADLVVLSACETGLGAKIAGEGLVGLSRAFQVAGASTVVATQWRVADHSTATAMVAFHQFLQKGADKDEALRQAMRTIAANPSTAHPFHWAPFVLLGDFHPLPRTGGRR